MSSFTPQELKQAAEELKALTPEGYLEQTKYMQTIEKQWPEAPASATVDVNDPNGWRPRFTVREFTIDALVGSYSYMMQTLSDLGFTPNFSGAAIAPATAPNGAAVAKKEIRLTSNLDADVTRLDMFEVETICHLAAQSTSNKPYHYLLCKGGIWKQYGWKAYPEVIPTTFDLNKAEIGVSTAPPDEMKIAYFDKETKKIVAFAAME
jgi:hypothetical protein